MPVADLAIVYRDPRSLEAYARNSRTHSPEQIEALRGLIREFGFTNPVLLKDDDRTIGAGHARTQAAIGEGLAQVPTITLHGLTDTQWRAYVIADNRLAEQGSSWDPSMLKLELGDLKLLNFDLSLTGFTALDLTLFERQTAERTREPDDVPPAPEIPTSRVGDLWLLGDHRLYCGDATKAEDVKAAIGTAEPMLMVTDQPYGVDYDPAWRVKARNGDGSRLSTGKHAVGQVTNDDKADWREVWRLFPGDVAYVWHGGLHGGVVTGSLEAAGFLVRAQIIWTKGYGVISRGDYHWAHEPAFYAVRKGKRGHWAGDRKQTTVWQIDKPKASESGHSTQKPVECMLRPIRNNSVPGQAVYDPFMGSGTTIVAAELSGRKAIGLEIHPPHVDVAVIRWQEFAGKPATLAATGQTFAEVKAQREAEAKPTKKGGRSRPSTPAKKKAAKRKPAAKPGKPARRPRPSPRTPSDPEPSASSK